MLSVSSLYAQEAETCPLKAQERTGAWSCLSPQDTAQGGSQPLSWLLSVCYGHREMNTQPGTCITTAKYELRAKPVFLERLSGNILVQYSLARIFQWSSELPRWIALQERRKGPCSWAGCRSPAGGAAACWGGPSPAAVGAMRSVSQSDTRFPHRSTKVS